LLFQSQVTRLNGDASLRQIEITSDAECLGRLFVALAAHRNTEVGKGYYVSTIAVNSVALDGRLQTATFFQIVEFPLLAMSAISVKQVTSNGQRKVYGCHFSLTNI